jgi:hypothetical protein
MHTLWQDLRYGLRGLGHRPAFAVLAVLTLALGIGAATTIFSVIQNVLLDPFPYTDAARVAMIQIHDSSSSRPGGRSAFQVPEFLEYQQQNQVFDEAIGGGFEDVLQKTGEGTEQFNWGYVTPNNATGARTPTRSEGPAPGRGGRPSWRDRRRTPGRSAPTRKRRAPATRC